MLLKLQKSCKHFFAKKNVIVANERGLYKFIEPGNELVFVNEDDHEARLLRKAQYCFTELYFFADDFCSKFRPYVYELNLSILYISWANLSLIDIDFLLTNNKMDQLYFFYTNIRDANENAVPIDYILGKVPQLTCFCYNNISEVYSNETLEKINSIKLCNKLSRLSIHIRHTSEELDPEIIGEFITSNMVSFADVKLYFPPDAPEMEPMKAKVEQIRNTWTAPGQPPRFHIV